MNNGCRTFYFINYRELGNIFFNSNKPGRVKKLRLLIVLVGLGALAIVSTFFGMMMAITYDLPRLEEVGASAIARGRNDVNEASTFRSAASAW